MATNTHSKHVIFIDFPLQQWLHKLTSVISYRCIACLGHCTCHFLDLFLSNSFCFKWQPCGVKFSAACTYHISCILFKFQSCRDVQVWWQCWLIWVLWQKGFVPSGGEERNAYRHSLLWLMQFKTSGNCLSFSFKDFLCNFGIYTIWQFLLLLRIHNTFTAIVDISRFNNSCLKSPASTLVDLTFQSRALRSFS